jgi:hypothetical protein
VRSGKRQLGLRFSIPPNLLAGATGVVLKENIHWPVYQSQKERQRKY